MAHEIIRHDNRFRVFGQGISFEGISLRST